MTRRDFIAKWFVYGLGLFPIWVLDCYILSRYPVYGVTPILLPLAVAAVASLEGQMAGGAFGMWVGFVWETTYPGGAGLMVFVLTISGYIAGTTVQFGLKKGFFGYFLCACSILVGVEAVNIIIAVVREVGTVVQIVPFAIQEMMLTICYTPIVYGIFHKVFRKIGKRSR